MGLAIPKPPTPKALDAQKRRGKGFVSEEEDGRKKGGRSEVIEGLEEEEKVKFYRIMKFGQHMGAQERWAPELPKQANHLKGGVELH